MPPDACAEEGLEVAALPEETLAELDAFLPGWWSRGNPVDLVAGNDLMLLPKAVETVIKSPAVDAVIVLGVGYIADSVARFAESDLAKGIGLDHFRQLVKKAAVPEHMVLQTVRETVDATRTAWTEQCRHYDLPNEIRMSIQKHMDDVLLSL